MKITAASKATQPIKNNNAQKQVSFKASQPIIRKAPQKDAFVSSKAKAKAVK